MLDPEAPRRRARRSGLRVSVIIPVFNQLACTKSCLDALTWNTPQELYELVVVDNGSTDGTREFLGHQQRNITVITNEENLGFAKACNQGAAAASGGTYLLFLNNDVEVGTEWLEPLVNILDRDRSLGAAGSRLLFEDGRIQHAGVVIYHDQKVADNPLRAFHSYYGKPGDMLGASQPRTYQALTAACYLVRKTAFEVVGGFDEGYWNGYEDVDLCFKLQRKGWKLVYQPESTSIHHESRSGPQRFARVHENEVRLNTRWLGKIQPDFTFEANGVVKKSPLGQIQPYWSPKIDNDPQPQDCQNPVEVGVSIVIPTRDQLECTKMCLESIREHTPERHEIILVDNGSTDGTVAYLEADSRLKLIKNSDNQGFPAACNQGIREAQFPYVMLLNNDTVVTDGWLRGLLECAIRASHIGVVGPRSNCVAGPQLIAGLRHNDLRQMHRYARDVRERNRGRWSIVPTVKGFCMLLKRQVFEKVGLLDERFGLGNYEDDDLCLRAERAGFSVVVVHDVFVHHFGSKTFTGCNVDYLALSRKNQKLFDEKWALRRFESPPEPVLSLDALVERAEGVLEEGRYERAEELLLDGLSRHEGSRELLELLKDVYLCTGRTREAKETLELLLQENFSDPEVNFSLGQIALMEKRLGEAERYFANVLRKDSRNPEAHNQLGMVYHQKGLIDRAKDCYGRAINLKQDFSEAWFNKGILLQALHQDEEAVSCLETCLDLDENNPLVHSTIGSIYVSWGDRGRGLSHLERSLALDPDQPQLKRFYDSLSEEAGSHGDR